MTRRGFPHSDIPGSKLVCSSPRLIAAYRVLHRLLAPRHSPYALSSLTTSVSSSRQLTPGFGHRLWEIPVPGVEGPAPFSVSSLPSLTACDFRKELPFAGYSVVKDR